MPALVPVIPIADYRHAQRMRRPYREGRAFNTGVAARMSPKLVVRTLLCTFREQPQIHLAEQRAVAIRIVDHFRHVERSPVHAQAIIETLASSRHARHEQAAVIDADQLYQHAKGVRADRRHGSGPRQEAADPPLPLRVLVRTEQGKRIAQLSGQQRLPGRRQRGAVGRGLHGRVSR